MTREIVCMFLTFATSVRTSHCLPLGPKKAKVSEVTRPINIGHDQNDSNIVYDWTGPDLTILSIVTIVEGDGALDPGVLGRRRKDAWGPKGARQLGTSRTHRIKAANQSLTGLHRLIS